VDDSADTAECDQAKPLRQDQAILQLRCQLVAIEVPACGISTQVIVGPIYPVPVERGLPGSRAKKGVIGKNLVFAQTRIFVKRSALRWYSESGVKPNTIIRFDPKTEKFARAPIPSGGGVVRNMAATGDGRVYIACSGVDKVGVVEPTR
jgi:hypothetical protein